jgi:hypothetical protein
MKINEKNLYTFANSKPVDKEGELALTFRAGSDFKMCPSEKKCFIRIHFLTFDFNFFFVQERNEISKALVRAQREFAVLF